MCLNQFRVKKISNTKMNRILILIPTMLHSLSQLQFHLDLVLPKYKQAKCLLPSIGAN